MDERLMEKLARLGAEAGIKQMTPEIYRFSMLVRSDVVAQWPERPWVDLTDEDYDEVERWVEFKEEGSDRIQTPKLIRYIEAKLKEKNT
jgi:hypothetical protein